MPHNGTLQYITLNSLPQDKKRGFGVCLAFAESPLNGSGIRCSIRAELRGHEYPIVLLVLQLELVDLQRTNWRRLYKLSQHFCQRDQVLPGSLAVLWARDWRQTWRAYASYPFTHASFLTRYAS